jgi:hypothetical protein
MPDGSWAQSEPTDRQYGVCERPSEAYGPEYEDGRACSGGTTLEGEGLIDFNRGYAPNSRCVWHLQCPDGGLPILQIVDFNTEANHDYGFVYDMGGVRVSDAGDDSVAEQLLGMLSGNAFTGTIVGTDGAMTAIFTSDHQTQQAGFLGSFQCTANTCVNSDRGTAGAWGRTCDTIGSSCLEYNDNDFIAGEQCCSCGGGYMMDSLGVLGTAARFAFATQTVCPDEFAACGTACGGAGVPTQWVTDALALGGLTANERDDTPSAFVMCVIRSLQATQRADRCDAVGCSVCYDLESDMCHNDVGYQSISECTNRNRHLWCGAPAASPPPSSTPSSRCRAGNVMSDAAEIDVVDYDNNLDCSWTLTCSAGAPSLTFSSFDTEPNFDFVYVFEGDGPQSPALVWELSGSGHTPVTYSSLASSSLYLKFTSDSSASRAGIRASFACVGTEVIRTPASYAETAGRRCDPVQDRTDEGLWNGLERSLVDGVPYTYDTSFEQCQAICDSGTSCTGFDYLGSPSGFSGRPECRLFWTACTDIGLLEAPSWYHYEKVATPPPAPPAPFACTEAGCDLCLDATKYLLEGGRRCDPIQDTELTTASAGWVRPPPLSACVAGTTQLTDYGIIDIQGYEDNMDCSWILTCSSGTPQLSFDAFHTEANYDFVRLFQGVDPTGSPIVELSGAGHAPMTTGTGFQSSMYLQFTTDGSVRNEGFAATFRCNTGPSAPYAFGTSFEQCKAICDADPTCTGIDHSGPGSTGHALAMPECHLISEACSSYTLSGQWNHYLINLNPQCKTEGRYATQQSCERYGEHVWCGATCVDNDNGAMGSFGVTCAVIGSQTDRCQGYNDADFVATDMCCVCGGGLVNGLPRTDTVELTIMTDTGYGVPPCAAGRFETSGGSECTPTATVSISIEAWGSEMGWDIDGAGVGVSPGTYSNHGSVADVEVSVSTTGEHTFSFVDSFGDGWHGGYWEVQNACGQTIAGGQHLGQVHGHGGVATFQGADLCCLSVGAQCTAAQCDGCLWTPTNECYTASNPLVSGGEAVQLESEDECTAYQDMVWCQGAEVTGGATCSPCPLGSYQHMSGQTTCLVCGAGTYTEAVGALSVDECLPCPAGYFDGDFSAATACDPCLQGYYNDVEGNTACNVACAAGTFSRPASTSIENCTACIAGQFDHDAAANTTCADCPAGRYGENTGSLACEGECAPGTFAPPGSKRPSSCQACPPGKTDHDGDSSSPCAACPHGRFSANVGSIYECSGDCGLSFYSPLGSTSQDACIRSGCQDQWASNYDETATVEGGNCEYSCAGLASRVEGLVDGCLIWKHVDEENDCTVGWGAYENLGSDFSPVVVTIPDSQRWIIQGRHPSLNPAPGVCLRRRPPAPPLPPPPPPPEDQGPWDTVDAFFNMELGGIDCMDLATAGNCDGTMCVGYNSPFPPMLEFYEPNNCPNVLDLCPATCGSSDDSSYSGVCEDDPGFTGGFAGMGCSSYAPGGPNSGSCEADGVQDACPVACGLCSSANDPCNVGWHSAHPVGSELQNAGTVAMDGYGNSERCMWELSCPSGGIIELQFEEFATEQNFDFLYVYDGGSTTSTQLGQFSGYTVPAVVESTGDTMLVEFVTDGSVTSPGFSGSFQCLQDACTTPATVTAGAVVHHVDTFGVQDCTWEMSCETGVPHVQVELNTQQGRTFLNMYDGETLISQLHGNAVETSQSWGGSIARLQFVSPGDPSQQQCATTRQVRQLAPLSLQLSRRVHTAMA